MQQTHGFGGLIFKCLGGLLVLVVAFAQTYKPEAIQEANLGVSLAHKEDYEGAVEAYQRALAIDPRLPNLYLNLGLAYFKQGQFREALSAFQKEPTSERITTLIGMCHFGLAEYREAASLLQPLAAAQPGNGELAYLLAKSYLWAAQYDEAMNIFRKLLEDHPDSAPTHMLLGEALDAADRETEATLEFEAAVRARPQQPEVHFGLGYLYWKQRRYREAEREFRLELKANPTHALSLAYLGDLLLRDGRDAEAVAALKRAEALNASLHVVHLDLGRHYQESKELDLAMREFLAAVRVEPGNYDAHYRLARIYQELGRQAASEEEFATVRKLHEQKREQPLMQISGPQ